MSDAARIAIPAWTAPLWEALKGTRGAPAPMPQVFSMTRNNRDKAMRRFIDAGVARVVEGGRGRRPAMVEALVAEVEIGSARATADGPAAAAAELPTPPIGRRVRPPATRDEGDAAVVGASSSSPLTASVEAMVHGVVADALGSFARIAETLAGGLRRIETSSASLAVAIATPESGDRIAALERQVDDLKAERDQALRDREAALSIAGRARAMAEARETELDAAIRILRSRGDEVVKGTGEAWRINGGPRQYTRDELIYRAGGNRGGRRSLAERA